jgi:hypothetical protein
MTLLFSVATVTGVDTDMQKARSHMNEADYSKAQKIIRRTLAQEDISEDNLLALYSMEATCWVSLRQPQKAQSSFAKLLTIAPGFTIPDSASRKEKAAFQKTVVALSNNGSLHSVFEPVHVPIGSRTANMAIDTKVSFKNKDKSKAIDKVTLFIRHQGKPDYTVIDAASQDLSGAEPQGGAPSASEYRITIPRFLLPENTEVYAVEYYLEAYSLAGIRLVQIGSQEIPLSFLVLPSTELNPNDPSGGAETVLPIIGGIAGVGIVAIVSALAVGAGVAFFVLTPKTGRATVSVEKGSTL